MGAGRDDSMAIRHRRGALVAVLCGLASPFVLGVVSAQAEELPVTVEEVVEPAAEDTVPEPTEPAGGTAVEEVETAIEAALVTITPSIDEAPVVASDEAGPTVTVEPATEEAEAEVTVTAVAEGPDTLAVLITPETVDVTAPPVPPLAITVTAPSADLDRPTALLQVDDAGAVTGVTLTPAAGGPDVLEVDLWGSAGALEAPVVDVGDAGSSLVRITLPAPPVVPGVSVTAPALAAGLPTVKVRSLGAGGDVVRVTLVPNPLPLPPPTIPELDAVTPEPLPDGDDVLPPGADVPPTTVAPTAPSPPDPTTEPVTGGDGPTTTAPTTTAQAKAPATSTAPAAAAAPSRPTAPATSPAATGSGGGLTPDAAPRVVTGIGRRSVDAARRFPVPTGLAVAVGVFLLVQGRVDRRDPRLAATPGHDEVMSFR